MTHRASRLLCAIGLAALVQSCANPELPMAPSDLATGIIVYEHANFLGNSAHIESGT